jgi:hypothetical protein
MEEIFDGIVLNGKRFPFVRVTESMQPKIVKRSTKLDWRAVLYNFWKQKARNKYIAEHPQATYKDLILEGLVYSSIYQSKREWKIIRSVAFDRSDYFFWKWFRLRIFVPYELRCNIIETRQAREIKKKFDNYLTEVTKDHEEPIDSSNNLATENI